MAQSINISDSLVVNPSNYTDLVSFTTSSTQYPISNGYTNASSTTYARFTVATSTTGHVYYTFNTSALPSNATITSIAASVKIRVSNTSYVTNTKCQLYTGTTAKGSSSTFASTSSSNTITLTPGNWTAAEVANLRLYIEATGSSSTNNKYVYFYGANITINYTIATTQYTLSAVSNVDGVSISPAAATKLAGESQQFIIDFGSVDMEDIVLKDNDIDVTEDIIQRQTQATTTSDTFIPSSFDSTNSVYNTTAGDSGNGVYSTNYINNGLTDSSSTTRCALYTVQGSGSISYMYYNFDCSSIPANATINSVSCTFKGGTQGSSYYSAYTAQLTTGTTLKGSSTSVTGSNSSPSTVTINGGSSWTRAELNNIKIKFQVTRGSSNTTTDSTFSFFGATLTVNYSVTPESPYYYTYDLSNMAADHNIVIDLAGAFIPPEEDPELTYYPLTISSINASTNPRNGTTRVVAGTNQIVTITPSDPQLTLALDNGIDITSQLIGGIPSNTYTVTTQVSGASYGFNLNSGTGYYVSTNNGQAKSASVARLNMDFESDCLVTIQYINYAEATYDYGLFGKLDTAVATDGLTASSNGSSPSDSTSNYQLMCNTSAYNQSSAQTITYTVPAGQHFIDIKYGKDDASDSGNDTLQWKVLTVEATGTGGDYTYTLTNIQASHNLIFIFGDVDYYYITATGGNCKLFPNGQIVKLDGDSYYLTIVPDDPNATVSLLDNNVDRTNLLEYEEGIDKYNNTVVNYIYRLTNISATHNLVISCVEASTKLYIKANNGWVQVTKVYKKINGAWAEQSDIASVITNQRYMKQN